jgi:hypothetical protein
MKSHKLLPVVAFIGLGILGFIFAYNFIYSLAANIAPVIPMEAMVFALPIAIGLLLVPYAVKSENRKLIYIGNMISVVFSLIFVYQTASLCLSNLSGALNIALLITMIWPLMALATSLTMMAFMKKVDFKPIHNVVLIVSFIGIILSFLITALTMLVVSIRNNNGLVFGAFLPTLFVFLSVAPVVFMAFALKDEARLVQLEVPEWVKPVKPAPTPKAKPQKEELKEKESPGESVEQKEDTPKE